jgi:hypothetical protein
MNYLIRVSSTSESAQPAGSVFLGCWQADWVAS